jgi:PAS domain S-box-containing protein
MDNAGSPEIMANIGASMRPNVAIPNAASFGAPKSKIDRPSRRDTIAEEAHRIAGVGIWHYDYASDAVSWSHELFRIFGVSPDNFHPSFENFLECVHPEDREAMRAADNEAALGKPMSFEHRILRPDGEVRYVHEQAQIVICDELGGRPVLIGTTQDITERKEAEAKMKDMQAEMIFFTRHNAMVAMATTLAHEVNQPLAAISNYATALRRMVDRVDTDGSISRGMAEIERNALRAGEIVRRIRGLAEQRESRKERIDFDELVRGAAEFSTYLRGRASFDFDGRATGLVLADRIQIGQVLTNLIKNACEAMERSEPRLVTITTYEDADQVTVCVSDTGPGLPPALDLFEPIISSKEQGMGIGLSICRTIIESNGGRIWAEPCTKGARICFSLPRADGNAPQV